MASMVFRVTFSRASRFRWLKWFNNSMASSSMRNLASCLRLAKISARVDEGRDLADPCLLPIFERREPAAVCWFASAPLEVFFLIKKKKKKKETVLILFYLNGFFYTYNSHHYYHHYHHQYHQGVLTIRIPFTFSLSLSLSQFLSLFLFLSL